MKNSEIRAVFSSTAGQEVLLWLLHEHHVFNIELKTEQEIALHNWGMKLLAMIGPKNTKQSVTEFIKMAQAGGEK